MVDFGIDPQSLSNVFDPSPAQGNILVHDGTQYAKLVIGAADELPISDGTTLAYGKIADANVAAGAAIVMSKITGTKAQFDTALSDDNFGYLATAQTWTQTQTLNSFKGTGAVTVTNILDEDAMGSDSATALATQQSIKAYVDNQVILFDTLAELTDVTITTRAANQALVVNGGNTAWVNALIVNANLASGAFANITGVGTIASGTWEGTAIASAFLDADTAHLSGIQTFTGAKTFSANITMSTGINIDMNSSSEILWGTGLDTGLRESTPNRMTIKAGGTDSILIADSFMRIIDGFFEIDNLTATNEVVFLSIAAWPGVVGQDVADWQQRGQDSAGTNVTYSRQKSFIRDATPGSINGGYQIFVAENEASGTGSGTLYMEFHGGNLDIDVLKDLDMAANILMGGNDITGVNSIAFNFSTQKIQASANGIEFQMPTGDEVRFTQTDAVSIVEIFRSDATPLDNDIQGQLSFIGNHDGSVTSVGEQEYGRINVQAIDVTEDSEDASMFFATVKGGSMSNAFQIKTTVASVQSVEFLVNVGMSGSLFMNGGDINTAGNITLNDAKNFVFDTTTGTKIGTATGQKLAFYGGTPIVQPTALTAPLTTLTNAGTASDFAIQAMVDSGVGSAWGFVTQAEGETVVEVVLNNQARINELETKLQALTLVA